MGHQAHWGEIGTWTELEARAAGLEEFVDDHAHVCEAPLGSAERMRVDEQILGALRTPVN